MTDVNTDVAEDFDDSITEATAIIDNGSFGTRTIRFEPHILNHDKIFRLLFESGRLLRFTVQITPFRQTHAFTTNTTASTAMPSLRPVNPSRSLVVALTLIC